MSMPPDRRASPARFALGLSLLAVLVLLPPSCSDPPAPTAQPVAPVLIIGVDGLEWSVLQPLLAQGRCPNLLALMERGSYGRLYTLKPTLSPMVWTTIATGRAPADHNIVHFLDPQGREFTSSRRGTRALWNIANIYGLSTNVFGWFVTWPVEEVDGVMVSGSASSALIDANWKPALLPGVPDQVHPPELTERVLAVAAEAGSLERVRQIAREQVFGQIPEGLLDAEQQELMQETLWSLQSDETFLRVALDVMGERPADLTMVYLGSPDVVGHRYWRPYEPEPFAWPMAAAAEAALADVIPNTYAWADEMIGELVAAAGPDTTIIVLSDHGMHAENTVAPAPDGSGMTGHHLEGAPGVIVAAGPGIAEEGGVDLFLRSGALAPHGTVFDVAPFVLALLGIPSAKDFSGRALGRPGVLAMLAPGPARDNAGLPMVETHDGGFREPSIVEMPAEMGENFKDRFAELGYLGIEVPAAEEIEIAVPDGEGR